MAALAEPGVVENYETDVGIFQIAAGCEAPKICGRDRVSFTRREGMLRPFRGHYHAGKVGRGVGSWL